jgi:hypothetical protein
MYRSDASEFGLGGYNITSGLAWRFELPVDCRLRTSLNSLEFLSCLITLWVDIISLQIEESSCLLCQTDSSTANGWLRKSNFAEKTDMAVQLTTARQLCQPYDTNKVLPIQPMVSWGGEHSAWLTIMRFPFTPWQPISPSDQVPFGLKIRQLPDEIASWLTSLLRNQPQKEPWLKAPMPSKFALGLDTPDIYSQSVYKTTCSSITSREETNTKSLALSLKPSERVDFVIEHLKMLRPNQSEPPWTVWHRPTSWLTEQTRDLTPMENLHLFYKGNYEDTLPPTIPNPHK